MTNICFFKHFLLVLQTCEVFAPIPTFLPLLFCTFSPFFALKSFLHSSTSMSLISSVFPTLALSQSYDKCFLGSSETADANRVFCGQLGAIYVFSEALNPAQIFAIHQLGPSYKVCNWKRDFQYPVIQMTLLVAHSPTVTLFCCSWHIALSNPCHMLSVCPIFQVFRRDLCKLNK